MNNLNKYKQIFTYLKEFAKLRNKVICNIASSQYKAIWLNNISNNADFYNALLSDKHDKNYWLKLKKPKEPKAPKPIKPPIEVADWLDEKSLYDENKDPVLRAEITRGDDILYLEDYPKLQSALDEYIHGRWVDDFFFYQEKNQQYQTEFKQYQSSHDIYKELFKIYEESKAKTETHELIIGVGLFHYQQDNDSPRYYRHFITQSINLEYKSSALIVSVGDENPIFEDEFIRSQKLFDENSINDAKSFFKNIVDNVQTDDIDLFNHLTTTGIIDECVNYLDIESYSDSLDKPNTTDKKIVSYAPALILRQKSTSKLDEAYTGIIKTIESEKSCHIGLVDYLLDKNHQSNHRPDQQTTRLPETIYFPKTANQEQRKILERVNHSNAVLVQGPPGTGKSHTIANLICHLLATGNKVLATAYTKRALEVLKGQLPEKYRPLAVNYLGTDQASKEDLNASVNAIKSKLDTLDTLGTEALESQVLSDEKDLEETQRNIAKLTNERKAIIKQDTETIESNEQYKGKLVDVLEQLKDDEVGFSWYKDAFDDFNDNQLQQQLKQFITLNQTYQFRNLSDFNSIIELDKLPTPVQVKKYNQLSEQFLPQEKQEPVKVKFDDLDEVYSSIQQINQLGSQIQELYFGQALKKFIELCEKELEIKECLQKLPKQSTLARLDDTKIDYPKDKDLRVLKADANILLKFLNKKDNENKLQSLGWWGIWRLDDEIKERHYFVNEVTVNGSPCDTIDEFKTVIDDIQVKQLLEELDAIHSVDKNNYQKQRQAYQDIIDKAKQFKNLTKETDELVEFVTLYSGLNVQYLDTNNTNELLKRLEWKDLNNQYQNIKKIIDKSSNYLTNKVAKYALDNKIDFENLETYQLIYEKIKDLNNFKKLQQNLSQKIPNTIKTVLIDDDFSIEGFKNTLYFKHAQHDVEQSPTGNTQDLEKTIKKNQDKERGLIGNIGKNKAWLNTLNYVEEHSHLKHELNLWQVAIKKIGPTNSKRTSKYRKLAKEKMDLCKDIIPCWIMPLHQLVSTIIPKQGMYDYVIVDEASQLGIDAMLLLYLAKKIIIVGDDQQTSPEYIGVNSDAVNSLIEKCLIDIPNKEFYDTEHSFFDHASFYFKRITLRDHFRCMPDIIAFSDKLCYANSNTALHPLRNDPEGRLTPLKHYFCDNGCTEGKGSNIINKPEAEAIVNKIAEIVKDKDYMGLDEEGSSPKPKTIGVITLQGNAQQDIIHNLLLDNLLSGKISEKDYTERKIVVGNAASFQGDERDIIFLSLVTAHNHDRRALTSETDKRRFNVAVSRAKDQVWLFHSVQLFDLRNHNDLRYKLLEHITTYDTPEFAQQQLFSIPKPKVLNEQPEPFRSWFEVEVHNDIIAKGYSVIPAHKATGYEIDLVPLSSDGTKIAVECDGDYWHSDEQYGKDMEKQDILERAGWQFFRIRQSDYIRDKEQSLQGLWELLQDHSTKPQKEETKENLMVDALNTEEKSELKTENEIAPVLNASQNDSFSIDTLNQQSSVLRFFNLYQSGDYVLSQQKLGDTDLVVQKLGDADLVVEITEQYKNGYLLQCYDNGHINKFDVSTLFTKTQHYIYKNGFNIKTNETIPKLLLIEKDEIIVIAYTCDNSNKVQCHLTEKLPLKVNLSIQGYKVVYKPNFSNIKYAVIPIEHQELLSQDNKRFITGFNAQGIDKTNPHYSNELEIIHRPEIKWI